MNDQEKIGKLRLLMKENKVDGYFLPHEDEFLSEYLPKYTERLKWLTNFSGSAGLAFLGHKKASIFVDGRYTTQVKEQTNNKIYNYEHLIKPGFLNWLKDNPFKVNRVGLDPKTISYYNYLTLKKICSKQGIELIETKNLIDQIWKRRKNIKSSAKKHEIKFAGVKSKSKIDQILKIIKSNKAEALFIPQPENVCWTLNIRGEDLEHTPILRSCLLIDKSKNLMLFSDNITNHSQLKSWLGKNIEVFKTKEFENVIKRQNYQKIQFDPNYTTQSQANSIIKYSNSFICLSDPITLMKSCKNNAEINGSRKAHLVDGIALTKFIHWLENEVNGTKNNYTEISLARKLLNFRQRNKDFKGLSFGTISSLGSNGAVIHYQPEKETDKDLSDNDIYLLDSGGQYKFGTTDVTRTILNKRDKKPKDFNEISNNYTLVLKGHIAVAASHFKKGETGKNLDNKARKFLIKNGLNYDHGTGHGVGSYLGVHEGPQSISPKSSVPLLEGMIISNEPGYYKPGHYGIRIENLVTVIKSDRDDMDFCFETLTLAPISKSLINIELMNKNEINWINNYHKKVYKKLSSYLNKKEKKWLKEATEAI